MSNERFSYINLSYTVTLWIHTAARYIHPTVTYMIHITSIILSQQCTVCIYLFIIINLKRTFIKAFVVSVYTPIFFGTRPLYANEVMNVFTATKHE